MSSFALLSSLYCSMLRWGLMPMNGVIMTGCTKMPLVILLNHSWYQTLSELLISSQLLPPCCRLCKEVVIIPPVVLFFSLVLPSYFQLKLASKPS